MKYTPPTTMRSSKSTGDLRNLELNKKFSVIPKSKSLGALNVEAAACGTETQHESENDKKYLQLVVVEPYETKFQKVLRERNVYFYANEKDMELLQRDVPEPRNTYKRPRNDLVDLIGLGAPLIVLLFMVLLELFA